MKDDIVVSVLCATYNHEKYIRDALDGFVTQKTDFKFEVIVHDDASVDGTPAIIREYENKYPDVIKPIYETENQYTKHDGTIRRLFVENARGKYVAVCEGDDYWISPDKLQKQVDFLESHPDYSECACSCLRKNMLNGSEQRMFCIDSDRDVSLKECLLWKERVFVTTSVLIRKEVYDSVPNWGFPIGDYPRDLYCSMVGKVYMFADVMCVYRWNADGSWTSRMADKRAEVSLKMIDAMNRFDEYTEYKYHDLVHEKILVHQYTYAIMTRNFRALRTGELGEEFKKRDFAHRVSDFARCKFPRFYHFIQKRLGRSV